MESLTTCLIITCPPTIPGLFEGVIIFIMERTEQTITIIIKREEIKKLTTQIVFGLPKRLVLKSSIKSGKIILNLLKSNLFSNIIKLYQTIDIKFNIQYNKSIIHIFGVEMYKIVGALWKREKDGKEYFSGVIQDIRGDINIAAFPNNKKQTANQPDLNIVISFGEKTKKEKPAEIEDTPF